MDTAIKQIILDLHAIGAIKFGSFQLKSGVTSPIYLDLRMIVSYPKLLKEISNALWNKIAHLPFELICGVPYTALPIATCISIKNDIPMLLRRKEAKDYGTKKMIEGVFHPKQTCLIIEDVITSGSSILETIQSLQEVDLVVLDAVVVIDRGQGGGDNLRKKGFQLHSLFTLNDLLEILKSSIGEATFAEVKQFLKGSSNA